MQFIDAEFKEWCRKEDIVHHNHTTSVQKLKLANMYREEEDARNHFLSIPEKIANKDARDASLKEMHDSRYRYIKEIMRPELRRFKDLYASNEEFAKLVAKAKSSVEEFADLMEYSRHAETCKQKTCKEFIPATPDQIIKHLAQHINKMQRVDEEYNVDHDANFYPLAGTKCLSCGGYEKVYKNESKFFTWERKVLEDTVFAELTTKLVARLDTSASLISMSGTREGEVDFNMMVMLNRVGYKVHHFINKVIPAHMWNGVIAKEKKNNKLAASQNREQPHISQYRSAKRGVLERRVFGFDIDEEISNEEVFRRINQTGLLRYVRAIVKSSPRKHHIYIMMDGLIHPRGFVDLWEAINRVLGGDVLVKDLGRVLSTPGFLNCKNQYPINIFYKNPNSPKLSLLKGINIDVHGNEFFFSAQGLTSYLYGVPSNMPEHAKKFCAPKPAQFVSPAEPSLIKPDISVQLVPQVCESSESQVAQQAHVSEEEFVEPAPRRKEFVPKRMNLAEYLDVCDSRGCKISTCQDLSGIRNDQLLKLCRYSDRMIDFSDESIQWFYENIIIEYFKDKKSSDLESSSWKDKVKSEMISALAQQRDYVKTLKISGVNKHSEEFIEKMFDWVPVEIREKFITIVKMHNGKRFVPAIEIKKAVGKNYDKYLYMLNYLGFLLRGSDYVRPVGGKGMCKSSVVSLFGIASIDKLAYAAVLAGYKFSCSMSHMSEQFKNLKTIICRVESDLKSIGAGVVFTLKDKFSVNSIQVFPQVSTVFIQDHQILFSQLEESQGLLVLSENDRDILIDLCVPASSRRKKTDVSLFSSVLEQYAPGIEQSKENEQQTKIGIQSNEPFLNEDIQDNNLLKMSDISLEINEKLKLLKHRNPLKKLKKVRSLKSLKTTKKMYNLGSNKYPEYPCSTVRRICVVVSFFPLVAPFSKPLELHRNSWLYAGPSPPIQKISLNEKIKYVGYI